jgi:hypothetical protein
MQVEAQAAVAAGIGHNQGPPSSISERLSEQNKDLVGKVEALALRANAGPREIKSEKDLDACGVLVKDASALMRQAEDARKREKQPFLDAGRDVDAFFRGPISRVERIYTAFSAVATDYQRKVAAEARRKAEEEARKAREEEAVRLAAVQKAEAENRARHAENHAAKAEAAAERAHAAEEVAKASAADLTRQRTDSGILATAKTEWSFEITDYAAIDLNALRMCFKREDIEKAIRLVVKNGVRELKGVRIFEDVKAAFR